MPSRSWSKGSRIEREIAALFIEAGIKANRVDEKIGQLGKTSSADVDAFIEGQDKPPWKVEIKARANGEGFSTLDKWLGACEFLVLRKDRAQPGVYMTWSTFKRLLWFVNRR